MKKHPAPSGLGGPLGVHVDDEPQVGIPDRANPEDQKKRAAGWLEFKSFPPLPRGHRGPLSTLTCAENRTLCDAILAHDPPSSLEPSQTHQSPWAVGLWAAQKKAAAG